MRGVAAVIVVFLHTGRVLGGYSPRFGYLAVDLFFTLSGFVLAHAYDERFRQGLGVTAFMAERARRLAPLALLGWLLGVVALFFHPAVGMSLTGQLGAAAANGLLLPAPWPEHGATLFPVDPPLWSLFFEFWIANLVFAGFWRRLHGPALFALVAACAALLVVNEAVHHSLDLGWTPSTFLFGLARVGYGFFTGVFLARLRARTALRRRPPSILLLAAVTLALFLPLSQGLAQAFELLCVLAVFPGLILLGGGARELHPALGRRLGEASYALYVIHLPLIFIYSAVETNVASAQGLPAHVLLTLALALAGLAAARLETGLRRRWARGRGARAIPLRLAGALAQE